MPRYLTCDAAFNFPVPSIGQVVDQLREMYDGRTPVPAATLARCFGVGPGAIESVLRHAAYGGQAKYVLNQGWVPAGRPNHG
jgi:hypothetical protein